VTLRPASRTGTPVVGLAHTDPRLGIYPARQFRGDVEGRLRQRRQQRQLPGRGLLHGLGPGGDAPGVISRIRRGHQRVQLGQAGYLGHRGQMPAAEPAHLAFHPTLLVRALQAGLAVEHVKPVVAAQRDEPLVLQPLPAQQDTDHRRLEVVQPHPRRHPTKPVKRGDEPVEKALLTLVGIRHMHRLARMRQPQHKHPQPDQRARDPRLELTEINLGFLSRRVRLRHRHHTGPGTQLTTQLGYERAHRRLRHLRTLLSDQPLPHPPGGVPLLPRRLLVLL